MSLMAKQSVMARPQARAMAAPSRRFQRAKLTVVAAKGGEEGGKAFDTSIAGTLAKNANYALLASAITKAGLFQPLSGPGPFTVFAPDDDAFGAACKQLGVSKLELMSLPNLPEILKYHVISGKVLSTDLKEGMEATTVNGQKLKFTLAGGAAVNGIKIKKANVNASNGVIHSIAAVLVPK